MNYYKLEYICNNKKIIRKAQISEVENQRVIEFIEKPNLIYTLKIKDDEIVAIKKGSINITVVHKLNKQQIIDYEITLSNNIFKGNSTITTTDMSMSDNVVTIDFTTDDQKYQEVFIIKGAI